MQINTKIVGVSFGDCQRNISELKSGDKLVLKREKNNKFDKNAIQVYKEDKLLGYLSRYMAEQVAPKIDSGFLFNCKVLQVTGRETATLGVNIKISSMEPYFEWLGMARTCFELGEEKQDFKSAFESFLDYGNKEVKRIEDTMRTTS